MKLKQLLIGAVLAVSAMSLLAEATASYGRWPLHRSSVAERQPHATSRCTSASATSGRSGACASTCTGYAA
jgi:hypothetical protein